MLKKIKQAFSLTELSVVVLLAVVVLVGILSVTTSHNITNKTTITNNRIGEIYKALKIYVGVNKRLPCPAAINVSKNDPAYGVEVSCAAETVVYGMVPVKALNLSSDFAEDDYGNKFVYVVDSTFTVATTPSKFVDQEGNIVVKRYSSSLNIEESNAIFAVISRGKNQRGAVPALATAEINIPTDVDELENMPSASDSTLIAGSDRSGTTFDDLVFFKNKKYFLADADLTKLQDSNMVGCTSGYTKVNGDCVIQCDVPTTIGVTNGSKVNQGTNQNFSCNAPNFKTTDSINYSCSASKVYTYNSGSCTCQTGYNLSGSSCIPTTCSITGVAGFNDKIGLPYTTTATAISLPCQVGYSGSPTYTCTTPGSASIIGTCTPITCTVSEGTGYAAQSGLPYTTGSSFSCSTGYEGGKNYTCLTSGAATNVSGTCTAITCTASSGTGWNAQSSLPYAASGSGSFNCNVTGYSGTKNYTCTTSGPATITGGTCAAITCSISNAGFTARTGLAYTTTATSTTCASGYSGSPTYTCTATGPATISGSCTVAGHWVLQTSSSNITLVENGGTTYVSTATCNSANNNKLASTWTAGSISGNNLSSSMGSVELGLSCYYTGSGGPPPCSWTSYSYSNGKVMYVYKCVYP